MTGTPEGPDVAQVAPPADLIREGREKLAAVTPGDWLIHDRGIGVEVHAPNGADSADPGGTHCLTDDDVFNERYVPGSTGNAEFIVWARNNLPAVLDALESMQAKRERRGRAFVTAVQERDTLWHALEQILHVQLHESMEWETVQRIVDAGIEGFDEAYGYPDIPNSYRAVTTAEDLDALPLRTVAVEPDTDHVWIRHSEKWHCSCDGTGVEWTSAEVFGDLGTGGRPLTVVWLPEES
ncbi:hypothetical protein FK530_22800 [Tsukamurella conjunctivitidis]|uniref:Uncharacterized protein n=1 Tax=Tsukamurella conjunctivitidis TaxID=2592068 RepID=A0A5C5RSH4_9ACTN|nr:hypothetical protein [Tsukamurella conjunctivitidis]TWS25552.1 hypothetical protein FK530_22800 [Tsukamurella conjunctivitidis]